MRSLSEVISIHALLAESDVNTSFALSALGDFYPRSPCGERHGRVNLFRFEGVISIHALLAESDLVSMLNSPNSQISIHALLAESDTGKSQVDTTGTISIHALLAESDVSLARLIRIDADFYPRSPCGERLYTD